MSEQLSHILLKEFVDKDYAHGYMHSHLLERLAAQIYTIRKSRGLSQVELAQISGLGQGKLSKLECAEVESFTLATLLKLAQALDVSVNVSFEAFSTLARRVEASGPKALLVASREQDLKDAQSVNTLLCNLKDSLPVVHRVAPVMTLDQPPALTRTVAQ